MESDGEGKGGEGSGVLLDASPGKHGTSRGCWFHQKIQSVVSPFVFHCVVRPLGFFTRILTMCCLFLCCRCCCGSSLRRHFHLKRKGARGQRRGGRDPPRLYAHRIYEDEKEKSIEENTIEGVSRILGMFPPGNVSCSAPDGSAPSGRLQEEGVTGLEFDVQVTKDGHLFVFHDRNLSTLCVPLEGFRDERIKAEEDGEDAKDERPPFWIRNCTAEQMRRVRFLSNDKQRIPEFSDLIREIQTAVAPQQQKQQKSPLVPRRDVQLLVDIKCYSDALITALVAEFEKSPFLKKHAVVVCGNPLVLHKLRTKCPELRLGWVDVFRFSLLRAVLEGRVEILGPKDEIRQKFFCGNSCLYWLVLRLATLGCLDALYQFIVRNILSVLDDYEMVLLGFEKGVACGEYVSAADRWGSDIDIVGWNAGSLGAGLEESAAAELFLKYGVSMIATVEEMRSIREEEAQKGPKGSDSE